MPVLKQLSCWVESKGEPLQEYVTSYGDGIVQSHILVPAKSASFSIRLRSNDFIASGLAMFVYIDGIYQCNRNRHCLKAFEKVQSKRETIVNFRVARKERYLLSGTWLTQDWRFEKLDGVSRYIIGCPVSCPKTDRLIQYQHKQNTPIFHPRMSLIIWEILKLSSYGVTGNQEIAFQTQLRINSNKDSRLA